MAEETNNNFARITYFEPNELFGGDNQPVKQEDLTKYVNLSVRIPSRFYNESVLRQKYESILKGTPFIEKDKNGNELTKLYLTDNYVNVSYTEFDRNGGISNGELFGIESINISFDVQFQPIVVINFTDVKGFGLMSTMEYNYEQGKINNLTAKSFFTSLFNFPYPIFTLEVKGYYGKSVSFDLALKDFHTAFDSNTGNFKTTVSFIGHLYGVYGDIPMSYLMISPYIDYRGVFDTNSNSECVGETWKGISGPNILTYLGFLHKYIELLRGEGINVNNMQQTQNNISDRNKLNILTEINKLYDRIVSFAETQLKGIQFRDGCFMTTTEGATSLFESTYPSNGIDVKFYDNNNSFCILTEISSTINETCEYNKQIEDRITNGIYDAKYKLKYSEITFENNNCTNKYKAYRFTDLFQQKKNIEAEISELTSRIEKGADGEFSEINRLVTEKMGFTPTIKNVYKMIFKHLDCFSRQFYGAIKSIDQKRILPSNGIYHVENINETTPPFPLVYKETNNGNEIVYPGDVFTTNIMKELEFVEKINDSIEYFSNKFANAIHTISIEQELNYNVEIKGYGPFFCDFIDPGKSNYFILQKSDIKPATNEKMAEAIKDMFLARLATYIKIHYLKDKKECNENYFNEKESTLLYSSAPFLHKDVISFLERYSQDADELFEKYQELSGGTDWGFTTYPPGCDFTSGNTCAYKQIHSNNVLENCVIIFKSGTRETCDAFISENFDDHFGFIFHKPINSAIHNEGYKLNKYTSKSLCTSLDTRTYYHDGSVGYTKYVNGCTGFTDMHYLKEPTVFTCEEYASLDKHPFFRWFSYDFQYKEEIAKKTSFQGFTYYTYDHGTYEKATNVTRDNLNRAVSISLAQLLGIGEAFYHQENDSYFIPITFFKEENAIWDEGVYVGFRKKFKGDSLFEKLTKGLYKTFFNLDPTSEDREYYNYFKIPTEIGSLDKAYDYWYAIGKNFEYLNNVFLSTTKDDIKTIFNDFVKKIKEKYGVSESIVEVDNITNEQNKGSKKQNIKLNLYYSLKNLYEKWFSGLPSDFFNIEKKDSEFNKVEYLTTTFNDISDSLIVNIETLVEQISSIKDDIDEASKSVISFMANTAQKNLSSFLVLPTKIFNENLKDAFKPFNFFNGGINHDPYGSTYVVMYNDDVSHQLDIPGSEVENDGYMIADYVDGNLEVTDVAKKIMHVKNTHNHELQSFGVTYGMQNQNFFKSINIDTQTPQITDYSIANMLKLAEQGSSMANGRNSFVKQHSIYPVYANRSYSCVVEMLGCMNITPLMYFQLNNVPMFKGAYIIVNVEHVITPHDFVTKFTGVRVSKYNIPMNRESLNLSRVSSIVAAGEQNSNGPYNETTLPPITNMDVSKDVINLDPTGIYFKGYKGTVSGGWCKTGQDCDMSARSTMRNLLKGGGFNIDSCGNEGGSYDRAIRLVSEKRGDDYNIYYYHSNNVSMQQKYRETVELIKEHLHKGYPIRVSVNHTINNGINEYTSDHFVAIYAYGIVEECDITNNSLYKSLFSNFNLNNYNDKKYGKIEYFRFYESASNHQNVGVNERNVFFYVDDLYPLFYCPSDHSDRILDVVNVFPYPDNIINTGTLLSFNLENYKSGIYDDGKNVKVPREKYQTYSI